MLTRLWKFLFGGCLHEFKWEQVRYSNCLAQRGVCTKCGRTKENTVAWTTPDGIND